MCVFIMFICEEDRTRAGNLAQTLVVLRSADFDSTTKKSAAFYRDSRYIAASPVAMVHARNNEIRTRREILVAYAGVRAVSWCSKSKFTPIMIQDRHAPAVSGLAQQYCHEWYVVF